jgi:hypothetical protein
MFSYALCNNHTTLSRQYESQQYDTVCAADYLPHYKSQRGGGMPSFRGGQRGAGASDILSGVFRFIVPVATTELKALPTTHCAAHRLVCHSIMRQRQP